MNCGLLSGRDKVPFHASSDPPGMLIPAFENSIPPSPAVNVISNWLAIFALYCNAPNLNSNAPSRPFKKA